MNQSNRDLLESEISAEFKTLENMELGSDEYKSVLDGLTKLIDRSINLDKLDIDKEEKIKDRESDSNYKVEQLNNDKSYRDSDIILRTQQMTNEQRDRMITNAITAAGIIIPSLITIWGTIKTLKFEEQGTVTTIMGRGFINKLLPKKWEQIRCKGD